MSSISGVRNRKCFSQKHRPLTSEVWLRSVYTIRPIWIPLSLASPQDEHIYFQFLQISVLFSGRSFCFAFVLFCSLNGSVLDDRKCPTAFFQVRNGRLFETTCHCLHTSQLIPSVFHQRSKFPPKCDISTWSAVQ